MSFTDIELKKFLEIIISTGVQNDLADFFVINGGDKRTPNNIIKKFKDNGNEIDEGKTPNKKTIELLYRYHQTRLGDAPFYNELKKRLGVEYQNQEDVKKFCGLYNSYYASEDRGFQTGTIDIECNDQNVISYTSYTKVSGDLNYIKHVGFAFKIVDHLYLTGLGTDFSRPFMIDIANKDVKNDFLQGIVLSVTANSKRIFARRVMLHHKDCIKAPFNTLTEEQIMKELSDATSEHIPMMLHVNK